MFKLSLQKRFFLLLGVVLSALVAYKAGTISFTHDESATYNYFHTSSIIDLFTDPGIWHSANNHILNTICYQASIASFGLSDFAMRLPNMLAFIGLLVICYSFLFSDVSSSLARWLCVIFLLGNPYVLDFFSLCRGYGLSMFFHFSALVFLYRYVSGMNSSYVYFAFAGLFFAALSLLTNLILLPVYALALWIILFKRKQFLLHAFIAPVLFGLLSLVFLFKPIKYLSQFGEFEYGVSNMYLSFKSFVSQSLGFHNYFGDQTAELVTVLFIIVLVLIIVLVIKRTKALFFGLALIILALALIAAYYFLHIQFPSERKTTIYVPLIAMLLGVFWQEKKKYKFDMLIVLFFGLAFAINMFKSYWLDSVIEWHYDRFTKNHIKYLSRNESNKVKLKTHWLFHPTSQYYIDSRNYTNIELLPYDKEFVPNEQTDYLLGFNGEMTTLKDFMLIRNLEDIALYKKNRNGFNTNTKD